MPATWIFQAVPKVYRIRDAVRELTHIHWTVGKKEGKVAPGDVVYIWEAGSTGGLIARSTVEAIVDAVGSAAEIEDRYCVGKPTEEIGPSARLRIDQVYSQPITRAELQSDPVLSHLRLIKNPRGTHFRVGPDLAASLAEMAQEWPTFREILSRYREERVVFSSLEQGALYSISQADADGCEIARLNGGEPVRASFERLEGRIEQIRKSGEAIAPAELDNTVAIRAALLQSAELGLSADRKQVQVLASEQAAAELLGQLVQQVQVDRSSGKPKRYKPAMIAAAIEAITSGQISDHRMTFDALLPGFLRWMEELGEPSGADQGASAFASLASDLFWNLAYIDPAARLEGNLSAANVRAKISHAVWKEPFRWILRKGSIREQALQALAAQWWPELRRCTFWWVNQGESFEREVPGNYIFASTTDQGGNSPFHWENVSRVQPGDILFHYYDDEISAVSVAKSAPVKVPRPATGDGEGFRVDVACSTLSKPIPIPAIAESIARLKFKYSPVSKKGIVNMGYLFELPPAAARFVAQNLDLAQLPAPIAGPVGKLLADAWDPFIYWASRFWEIPANQTVERTFKLKLRESLRAAEQTLASGGDWQTALKPVFKEGVTDYRTNDDFFEWCESQPDAAIELLRALWDPKVDTLEAMKGALKLLPNSVVGGAGMRVNFLSLLAMGRDSENFPLYKPTPYNTGFRLTSFPVSTENEQDLYPRAMDFLDRILKEAAVRGLALRDRLDAQSVLWCVAKYDPPNDWPREDKNRFERYRSGMNTTADLGNGNKNRDGKNGKDLDPILSLADRLFLDVAFLREITTLLEAKRQVIFHGPPGTGKTYIAKELAKVLAPGEGQVEIVQFHPSYAYEDFVEGFRPRLVNGQAGFQLVRGPLRRLAERATNAPKQRFVLLIDEINRGNVAKVFGELYFLLEYRDEKISLQYSAEPFALPPNLWVIGTMNTADRSIALLDGALRRRFYFVPFFPDAAPISQVLGRWLAKHCPQLDWLAMVVDEANRQLGSRHAAIGPSHFMRPDLDKDWVDRIWNHSIIPYLAEQFFGDEKRLEEFALEVLKTKKEPPTP